LLTSIRKPKGRKVRHDGRFRRLAVREEQKQKDEREEK